jgi:hypothetical protein
MAVAQRIHVRAIEGDPVAELVGVADRSVAGNDGIDAVGHLLEHPQAHEVVPDRVVGAVKVGHRHQDIGQHVTGDEHAVLLDQESRMTGGMRRMLDDPDPGPVPGNLCGPGRQIGEKTVQIQRDLIGDLRR